MNETPDGFKHSLVDVGRGTRLHCVAGGKGEPLFLLHGFPQTWHEWRLIMPELARKHHVVAVDLKGAGYSDKPTDGYDKLTMAGELDALRTILGFQAVRVVGHDIGGMVAYAWAAAHKSSVSKLVIVDIPIPGVSAWDQIFSDPRVWHYAFFMKRDVPELLITGRERIFVEHFIRDRANNQGAFSPDDIDVFAQSLSQPGALRGAFEWYRAFAKDAADNRKLQNEKLEIPVLALGGDQRWGHSIVPMMRELANNVEGGAIADCGHWVVEEQPRAFLDALDAFLAS